MQMSERRTPWLLVALGPLLTAATVSQAQDIEPRAYSNAPIGVNFLIGGYVYTRGSLPTDPAIPLTNSHLTTSSAVMGYGRVFELLGQSAKVSIAAAYGGLGGAAIYAGQPLCAAPSTASPTQASGSPPTYMAPRP